MSPLSATSLAVTVAHAVTFLTRPLATRIDNTRLASLQAALEANLAAAFVSTWAPHNPTRGSGRRVLSFAAGALPPRPVYKACVDTRVEWAQWGALLLGANSEIELVVDPGCVTVRVQHAWGASRSEVVWSEEQEQQQRSRSMYMPLPAKTFEQRLMEEDAADEEALFSLVAAEIRDPTWKSPVVDAFPAASFGSVVAQKPSFLGHHSRSSSRSSINSASTFSDDALSSCGSLSSVSTAASLSDLATDTLTVPKKTSGHSRSRSQRVYVDTAKKEVTPYDGGKTTVLTGGVMLGAAPSRNSNAALRRVPRF